MKKTPGGGTTLGSRTHAYRSGAGALGDGERPAFVEFEPGNFPRLYQTAHSESTVDKWNNFSTKLGRGGSKCGRDNRPVDGAKKATEPSAQIQNWPRILRNRPQGLPTSFPATSGNCLAFATTDVDLLLAVARTIFEFP
jgi:hypothetical protein